MGIYVNSARFYVLIANLYGNFLNDFNYHGCSLSLSDVGLIGLTCNLVSGTFNFPKLSCQLW